MRVTGLSLLSRFASRSEICAANALISDPHLETIVDWLKSRALGPLCAWPIVI
jgi:hypothetical protein